MSTELIDHFKRLAQLSQLFFKNNYELYMVGGAVRDILMSKTPHDYDFATNATPDQMLKIAEESNIEVIPTGIKYGTVTFRIDGESFECTSYRADGNYSDGRRPDQVTFSTNILDDLSRRDFTVNAIALNMLSNTNDYVDPFDGINDIKNKIIRTVGDPVERFTEDGLRILRAIRFKYKLGFKFDNATYEAIVNNWNLLEHVSQERITSELLMILEYATEPEDSKERKLLKGLLMTAFPELHTKDFQKDCLNCFHMKGAISRLACLLRCYGYPKDVLKRLKLSNDQIKEIMQLIEGSKLVANKTGLCAMDPFIRCYVAGFNDPYYIPRLLVSKYGVDNAEKAFDLFRYDQHLRFDSELDRNQIIFDNIKKVQNNALHTSDLKINGNDLISYGFEGKQIGEALDYLLDEVLYIQSFNTKEELKRLLRKKYGPLKNKKSN